MKRYQESSKIVKFWRCRWLLLSPFIAIYYYIISKKIYLDKVVNNNIQHTDKYISLSFLEYYKIAISEMQLKMNYYYTSDEVFKQLNNKFKN